MDLTTAHLEVDAAEDLLGVDAGMKTES